MAYMERPAITEIQALLDSLVNLAIQESLELLDLKELLALEERQEQEEPLVVQDHRDRPEVQVSAIIHNPDFGHKIANQFEF